MIDCFRHLLLAVLLLASAPSAFADDDLKALQKEYDEIEATFMKDLRAAKDTQESIKANEKNRAALSEWKEKALTAIRENREKPDTLGLIVSLMRRDGTVVEEMLGIVKSHHTKHPELGKVFSRFLQSRDEKGPAFVEEMVEKCPIEKVRGQAAYEIGCSAKRRVSYDGDSGFGFDGQLSVGERQRLLDRAEKYLTIAATKYPDAKTAFGTGTIGKVARAELAGLKNMPNLVVGKVAPEIEGEDLEGKKFKLSDSRGKVTFLVFWASWCGPCMKKVPHEKEMVERLRGKPFVMVGVNGDRELEAGQKAVAKNEIPWRSFWNGGAFDGTISTAWNLKGWPTIYVLDAEGKIHYAGHGSDKLDELVDKLLSEMEKK